MEYLQPAGTQTGSCSFFMDHHDDLPLLNAVGHTVAVNPSPKLRGIAVKRGWDIIEKD